MAGETTFKTSSQPSSDSTAPTKEGSNQTISTDSAEVPYTEYEKSTGNPYSVDYFGLGSSWTDAQGGFPKEISLIEEYFDSQISSGEIANSQNAIKERLKEILKVTGMNKEERNTIKIETVAAYVEFLMKTDDIKHNVKRYASTKS